MAFGRGNMGKEMTGNRKKASGGTISASPKEGVAVVSKSGVGRGTITANPKTGVATVSKSGLNPGYSAFSVRGLTSSDPANVNRNRAAAARYANMPLSGGSGDGRRASFGSDAPAAAPNKVMKRTYMGGPPAGYDPAKQGEWNYFKTELVDAAPKMAGGGPVKASKAPGMRGCGAAKRGTGGGKMT